MIMPSSSKPEENEVSVWTVATKNMNPIFKRNRQNIDFIQKQEGFVGVHPNPKGTLWLFKTKEEAMKARRNMDAKGIGTGDNIVEVFIEKKYL